MTPAELKERLDTFAVAIVVFCRALRRREGAASIADQLSDSATSMAANYHAACRARSRREFVSKIAVSVEEADETTVWLRLCLRTALATPAEVDGLLAGGSELLAILTSSRSTASRNLRA